MVRDRPMVTVGAYFYLKMKSYIKVHRQKFKKKYKKVTTRILGAPIANPLQPQLPQTAASQHRLHCRFPNLLIRAYLYIIYDCQQELSSCSLI